MAIRNAVESLPVETTCCHLSIRCGIFGLANMVENEHPWPPVCNIEPGCQFSNGSAMSSLRRSDTPMAILLPSGYFQTGCIQRRVRKWGSAFASAPPACQLRLRLVPVASTLMATSTFDLKPQIRIAWYRIHGDRYVTAEQFHT